MKNKSKNEKKIKNNKKTSLTNIVEVCERQYDMNKYQGLLKNYFAHRGVHNIYPENSLPAFNEAINKGWGIEFDVHLTKDGQLVVFHDDNLERMTGVNEYVRFLTLEELKKLQLNRTDYQIPTFEETLNFINGKVPILLEIKTEWNTKKICKKVIEELKKYSGEVFIQSFNPFALRQFHKLAPQYLRGQLSSFFANNNINFFSKNIIKRLKLNKFAHIDFVSYNIKDLPNKWVNKTNIPVLSWTIKTKDDFEKAKINSNNIIIDNFEILDDYK